MFSDMSSASGSNRSNKRLRTRQSEEPDPEDVRSAVSALLERLVSIREKAVNTRNEHVATIKEIDERIATKQTAIRAAARVVAPARENEITKYARGVSAKSSKRVSFVGKPTLPPAKLLMESDPPEKLIHEQSIIVRAQAISRKNAELARERLPKQPEAQRNKTHWDYLLDEAIWLSTDFREEHKWKVHMARRLARAVVAYHVQKDQRMERAAKAESVRIRRLANSLARDVRKFWSQIREIADLRAKQINDLRLQERRHHQLQEVLEEAGHLASALSASYMEESPNLPGSGSVVKAPKIPDRKDESPSLRHDSPGVSDSDRDPEISNSEEGDTFEKDFSSGSESYSDGPSLLEDDEATIDIAEEEDVNDPHETKKLEAEASMSVEELLRSRGIDPDSYRAELEEPQGNANGAVGVPESSGDSEDALETTVPRISGYSVGKDASPDFGTSSSDLGVASSNSGRTSSGRLTTAADGTPVLDSSSHPTVCESLLNRNSRHPTDGSQISTPGLLRGTLRSYQLAGVQWLVALYKKNVNGILADEMGLGKTIQTIALLAWLALEKGIWGPHLIVVPTSVMVNWEVELKKWLPAFKVLTYFGSQKERKAKRVGWTRPDSFHVCITSYTLVVQDAASLKRKEWVYLILDEAHNIKNFQSQRWQVLLRFPSARRLLLTGTPLQNSVMELWSLLHFLMPAMFESQAEFKDWFYTPISNVGKENEVEDSKQMVSKLHEVLRPFLLRRLKCDVEKSLRPKIEHIQKCPLSKRQRQLYEDFLARTETQNTLERGDFFDVMGVLMQLRKVCNHPDLFEGRPILSPLSMKPLFYPLPSCAMTIYSTGSRVDLSLLSLDMATEEYNGWAGHWHTRETQRLSAVSVIVQDCEEFVLEDYSGALSPTQRLACSRRSTLRHHAQLTSYKVRKRALLGQDKIFAATVTPRAIVYRNHRCWGKLARPSSIVKPLELVISSGNELFERFVCCIRKVDAPSVEIRFSGDDGFQLRNKVLYQELSALSSPLRTLFRVAEVRSSVTLPDARLVQWDCGKLQILAKLLRMLRDRSSRALIYSQMSKVLNILESFLNLHGIRYLRLDGSTKTGERQRIVERFNTDTRIFCMILTTRAGGVGLNLTGADTVIFYDTDYNPAIDAQAQDRVHRIGQKKSVHIYRLVSEKTVEENILRRANEKRTLESIVISQAGFNIDSIRKRAGVEDMLLSRPNGVGNANVGFMASLRKPPQSILKASRGQATGGLSRKSDISSTQQPKQIPVLSSHGPVKPFSWVDKEAVEKSRAGSSPLASGDEQSIYTLAEESDVYNTLLANDEERSASVKQDETGDEFLDPEVSESSPNTVRNRKRDMNSLDRISGSLSPVQRLALKFVEQGGTILVKPSIGTAICEPCMDDTEKENGTNLASVSNALDAVEDHGGSPLFYEKTTTPNSYPSSLKVLTDTDANIKMYLPLRDGGPEELNISTVVNGTAAAGLECAEDAAFFPHAYNRMSRTVHATKRQKEKAAYNLRRREEIEAKKLRDAKYASVQRAAAQRLAGQVQTQTDSRSRNVATKLRDETGQPPSKRARTDSSGSGANITGHDGGFFPGTNGLFKKNVKRNQRKVSSRYNKSSLSAGSGNLQLGEGVGKNDCWTIEEDRSLIELMSRYNGNMAIVADVMGSYSEVVSGNRRKRSIKQCCDHWFNSILKEHKNGPPAPTSNVSDSDVLKQNFLRIVGAAAKSSKEFRCFDVKPIQGADVHKSHARVTQEAKKATANKMNPSIPPTYDETNMKISVLRSHVPGKKPYECTAHAVQKKKNPFMKPLTDAMCPIMSTEIVARESNAAFVRATPPVLPQSARGTTSRAANRVSSNSCGVQNQGRAQSVKNTMDANKVTNLASHPQQLQKGAAVQKSQNVTSPVVLIGAASSSQNNSAVARMQTSHRTMITPMSRRPPIQTPTSAVNGGQLSASPPAPSLRQAPHVQPLPGVAASSKLSANSAGAHRRITATAPTIRKPPFSGKIPDTVLKPAVAPGVNRVVARKPKVQAVPPPAMRLQPRTHASQVDKTVSSSVPVKVEHRKVQNRTTFDAGAPPNAANSDSGTIGPLPAVTENPSQVPMRTFATVNTDPTPKVVGGVHKTNISTTLQASVAQPAVIASASDSTIQRGNGLQQQKRQVSAPTILVEKSKGPNAHT